MYGNRNALSAQLLSALALSFGTTFAAQAASIEGLSEPGVIPGSYIVQFAKRDPSDIQSFANAAQSIAASYGGTVNGLYELTLNGASMKLDPKSAERLAKDPRIASIAASRAPSPAAQHSPIWNLDRIDVQALGYDYQYAYPSDGAAGVDVFVIDSGVRASHQEFTGRIGDRVSFAPLNSSPRNPDNPTPFSSVEDDLGHGTSVSGVIAGTKWGVAKQATIHSVKIFNNNGDATDRGFFDAVEWVAAHAAPPAVVNMSLAFPGAFPMADDATQSLVDRGLVVVTAAGNRSADACRISPGRVPSVINVGATDEFDQIASFSNFGTCVDIMAPGVGVQSAYGFNDYSAMARDGTSFAAPHVAGAAALFLAQNPAASPAQVHSALVANKGNAGVLSTKFIVPLPPIAPLNLGTKAIPCGENAITWDGMPEATWYEAWSAVTASFTNPSLFGITQTPATTGEFPVRRHVKVRACNSKGCGPFQGSAVPTKASATCG